MTTNCSEQNKTNIIHQHGDLTNIYMRHTSIFVMETSFMPIWIFLGLPGAILSFSIWSRRTKQHPPCLFLSTLALVDTIFFPNNLLYYLNVYHQIPTIDNRIMCALFPFLNIFLQYTPPMLTLGFTAQRYISICHPFFTFPFCGVSPNELSVTTSICFTLVSLCFLIALPKFYFFQFGLTSDSAFSKCTVHYDILSYNYSDTQKLSFQNIMFRYEFATEILCFVIVPFIILILNIRVIVELILLSHKTTPKNNASNSRNQTGDTSSANNKQVANTTMLLLVSFYLLLATLPASVFQIMKFENLPTNVCLTDQELTASPEWQGHFLQVSIMAVADLISKTYYGAKFYIYIATSKWFRTKLIHQLSCCLIMIGCRHKPRSTNQSKELYYTVGRSTPRQPRMTYEHNMDQCGNPAQARYKQHLLLQVPDDSYNNNSEIDNSNNSNKTCDSFGDVE